MLERGVFHVRTFSKCLFAEVWLVHLCRIPLSHALLSLLLPTEHYPRCNAKRLPSPFLPSRVRHISEWSSE